MSSRIIAAMAIVATCQFASAQHSNLNVTEFTEDASNDGTFRYLMAFQQPPQHQLFAQLGMKLRQIEGWVIYDHLDLEDQTGMIVDDLQAKLPANLAGIEWHDIIATVDGKSVSSVDEFIRNYEAAEDEDVTVDVIHKGKRRTVKLNKETVAANGRAFRIGVEVEEVHESLAKYAGLEKGIGLYVSAVYPDKPAAGAGIKQGDVLVKVAEKALSSRKMLNNAIHESKGAEIELDVLRNGKRLEIAITPEAYTELSPYFGTVDLALWNGARGNINEFALVDRANFFSVTGVDANAVDSNKSMEALSQAVKELTAEVAELREQLKANAK